jgi:hypothetical protein
MGRYKYIASALLSICITGYSLAGGYGMMGGEGLKFAGDIWVTFRALDRYDSPNRNHNGDDPFNVLRVRTFLVKDWNAKTGMTIEFLWDSKAPPRVQGAYLTYKNLWGPFGARVGMIPSPFGNYGTRSTYFNLDPVIGVPAMWHYKTPLNGNGAMRNSQFFTGPRARARWNRGQPMAYDACWDYGMEAFWDKGIWDGSFAVTMGTLGNMAAVDNNGYQEIIRVGMHPIIGLRYGFSFATGPWLRPDSLVDDTLPKSIDDYDQNSAGYYFEYSAGYWQFFSEGMWTDWEMPFTTDEYLTNISAYLESRYNFSPGWYLAARYDLFKYSKISTTDDGLGPQKPWGYDFDRIEAAIGYRVIREGIIRLDYQGTYYREAGVDPLHLMAVQFAYAF